MCHCLRKYVVTDILNFYINPNNTLAKYSQSKIRESTDEFDYVIEVNGKNKFVTQFSLGSWKLFTGLLWKVCYNILYLCTLQVLIKNAELF